MQINLILQGKGGVGKSYIATLLAEYYASKEIKTLCYDLDPANKSFSQFKALKATYFEIMEAGLVNPESFDFLLDEILKAPEDITKSIIDNGGGSSFIAFCDYMVQNGTIGFLAEQGQDVLIHTIVTGGAQLPDTATGLQAICDYFPEAKIVLWINEFFGRSSVTSDSFEDTKMFKAIKSKIHSVIKLPQLQIQTYGKNIEQMRRLHLTFDEAINSPEFNIFAKQRLVQTKRNLFAEIEKAKL